MLRPLSSSVRPQALATLITPQAVAASLPPAAQLSGTALASKRQHRLLHVSSARLATREAPDHAPGQMPRADVSAQPIYMRRSFWAFIGALAAVEGGFWLWMLYFKDSKEGKGQDADAELETETVRKQVISKA